MLKSLIEGKDTTSPLTSIATFEPYVLLKGYEHDEHPHPRNIPHPDLSLAPSGRIKLQITGLHLGPFTAARLPCAFWGYKPIQALRPLTK